MPAGRPACLVFRSRFFLSVPHCHPFPAFHRDSSPSDNCGTTAQQVARPELAHDVTRLSRRCNQLSAQRGIQNCLLKSLRVSGIVAGRKERTERERGRRKKETEGENGNGPPRPLLIRRLPHHRQFLFAPVPLDNCPSPGKSHESDAT